MVKASKKVSGNGVLNPEAEERKRLKNQAFSNNLLSDAPARGFTPLTPSKTVIKHHGKDILRKSQRKNRYLFSFPGLLAPINGGKIGELTNLGSKNPILYLDFPQGRMKLFGTIVYSKNQYLTLQFSKGGKNVTCDDYFDAMIIFSDACWIGRKDENPDEARLDFPIELYEGQHAECDFQGGAGATAMNGHDFNKFIMRSAKQESHNSDLDPESPERVEKSKSTLDVTPARHSERTAGKTFKYTSFSRSLADYKLAETVFEKSPSRAA
ncbi:DNA-binding protein rhl1 [Dionaea muscipula]